jgi:hypothetical protein
MSAAPADWRGERSGMETCKIPLAFLRAALYNTHELNPVYLQGRVQFPTGGESPRAFGPIRCDSGTDSTVWMREDAVFCGANDTPEDRTSSGVF